MTAPSARLVQAAWDRGATEKELAGYVALFEGAVYRGDARGLDAATEATHAALQRHLDAIAGGVAIARKDCA